MDKNKATVSVKIDKKLKNKVTKIFDRYGLSTTRVIIELYENILLHQKIPFNIAVKPSDPRKNKKRRKKKKEIIFSGKLLDQKTIQKIANEYLDKRFDKPGIIKGGMK